MPRRLRERALRQGGNDHHRQPQAQQNPEPLVLTHGVFLLLIRESPRMGANQIGSLSPCGRYGIFPIRVIRVIRG